MERCEAEWTDGSLDGDGGNLPARDEDGLQVKRRESGGKEKGRAPEGRLGHGDLKGVFDCLSSLVPGFQCRTPVWKVTCSQVDAILKVFVSQVIVSQSFL